MRRREAGPLCGHCRAIAVRGRRRFARRCVKACPGRTAARSDAVQTRDRSKHRRRYGPGSAVHRFALHRVRDTGNATRMVRVCLHRGFTFQTARQASVSAPGNSSAPGRRPSCPPRKQSRGVKRHKTLVRNAAPVATLRSGQSLQRKGLPAHDAGRRALRRFTAVISVEPRSTRSGCACVPVRIAHRPLQQSSLRTGRYAHEAECPRRPGSPVD